MRPEQQGAWGRGGADRVQKVSGDWNTWGFAGRVNVLSSILEAMGSHSGIEQSRDLIRLVS